jgi:hypothetical protein
MAGTSPAMTKSETVFDRPEIAGIRSMLFPSIL